MAIPIYIGDEISAAGYRLAGVRVEVPGRGETVEVFRRALEQTDLLLLSVEVARRLPPKEVDAAICGIMPAVLVVPDLRGRIPVRDLPQRIRAELGVMV